MTDVLATLISGALTGGVWALLALAFVVVFRSTDVFNFATPEIGTFGAYVALITLLGMGWPVAVAAVGAVVVAAALSLVVERLLIRPLGENALFPAVVVTFGLTLILQAAIAELWGAAPLRVRPLVEGTTDVLGLTMSNHRIVTFGIAVVAMLALAAFFRYSRTGIAMLASAADAEGARVVGVDPKRVGQYAWAIGGGLAGLAAFLLAGQTFLSVTLLTAATVSAFAAMFLGGVTSMIGVVIGGFLVGILENVVVEYISVDYGTTAIFATVLLVLLLRPAGIFGSQAAARV